MLWLTSETTGSKLETVAFLPQQVVHLLNVSSLWLQVPLKMVIENISAVLFDYILCIYLP